MVATLGMLCIYYEPQALEAMEATTISLVLGTGKFLSGNSTSGNR